MQTGIKKTISKVLILAFLLLPASNICIGGNFGKDLDDTTNSIEDKIDRETVGKQKDEAIRDYIIYIGTDVFMPIAILTGIIMAIIGFYKIMFTESDEEQKKGKNFLIWGTIGIIIMTSAGYIANELIGKAGGGGIIENINNKEGADMAFSIYEQILYPFIQLGIVLIAGIMFVILLIQAIKFLLSPSEEIKTKSKTIVIWNTLGILIIIGAKEIVEAIYGSQNSINKNITQLGGIGEGILTQNNFQVMYSIINWALGLITFIVVVLVIYQTYLVLIKPDDSENLKKLKRNFVYIFIGMLLIAGGYLITNFLIIK